MKLRGITKRISALFLTAAMVVTMLPKLTTPVFAQGTGANALPDVTQFATAEQLKSFNTNDNDGAKNPAKVYFGNNNQQWWIAGSQQVNGLTLFAASPLATNQQFEPNYNRNKVYDSSWNCAYTNGNTPTDVFPNHYGASPLRAILKELGTSYFTGKEQDLMKDTTIYTEDLMAGCAYGTTDRLYLPYESTSVTVGNNAGHSPDNGLRVDNAYCDGAFWMCTPGSDPDAPYYVNSFEKGRGVIESRLDSKLALVPAFELDLSSVLFASTAQAAAIGGDTFILRYDAGMHGKNLGSALVSFDKSKVTLIDVPVDTYLVVQSSTGAKMQPITNEIEITAKKMGIESFANCRVWLETTDSANRMTYATMGVGMAQDTVALVDGTPCSLLELTDALNQAKYRESVVLVEDIAINTRLYIGKNIDLNLNGKTLNIRNNGIEVNRQATLNIINNKGDIINGLIINNGILTVDGSISCNIKTDSDSIIMGGTYSGNILNRGIIENGIFLGVVGSYVGSTIKNGYFAESSSVYAQGTIEGGQYKGKNEFYGSVNGGNFYSQVTLDGNKAVINGGNFAQEPIMKNDAKHGDKFVLAKTNNGNLQYKVIEKASAFTLDIKLGNNLILESGKLQQSVEKNVEPKIEIQPITVKAKDGCYLSDDYITKLQAQLKDLGLSVVKEGNKLTISGALSADIPIDLIDLNAAEKTDGNTVVGNPTVSAVAYEKGLTLKGVKLPEGWTWSAPDTSLSVGTQSYEATFDTTGLEDTHIFEGVVKGYDVATHKVTRSVSVTVKKGNSTVTITTQSLDKTYDRKPVSAPEYTTSGSDGAVTMKWQENKSGKWLDLKEAPINAGKYRVTAILAEDNNHTSNTSSPLEFTITKATPTPDKLTGLVLEQGQPLSKVKLPEQFKWVDDTLTANESGTHKFKAFYTPIDTVNYETVEVEVEVRVVPTPVEPNHVPTIHADDITLTVGDKFDPLKGVTATDKEDGTNVKLEVIKNTVDTTKAGTYEVVYKATDRDGATITKTIKVTVKAKNITVPDKDEDKDEDKDSSEHKAPETRDRTNLYTTLWCTLMLISGFALTGTLVYKKI